jgi:hypothetical protein
MVADGLRGVLSPPEDDFMVVFPAVWVSIITRKRSAPAPPMASCYRPLICICSYREGCKYLGYPNLAVLQMKPVWIIGPEGEDRLAEGFPYSVLAEEWAPFESRWHQRLWELGPVVGNPSADGKEFEKVANEWLSAKLPSTVSAFGQNNDQNTALDDSRSLDTGALFNPNQGANIPIVPMDTNVDYQSWQSQDDMHLIQSVLLGQLTDLDLPMDFTQYLEPLFSSPTISAY